MLSASYADACSMEKVNHSRSVSCERVLSDYSILKINTVPENEPGGDTLWASAYEAYDRLSPVWQKIAERLTATHY
jgi:alpha-ketoglutarate-dependent taurine dioxygenase